MPKAQLCCTGLTEERGGARCAGAQASPHHLKMQDHKGSHQVSPGLRFLSPPRPFLLYSVLLSPLSPFPRPLPRSQPGRSQPHSTFVGVRKKEFFPPGYTTWQGEGELSFSPLVASGLETLPQATTYPVTELELMEYECEVRRLWAKAPKI